MSGTCMQIAVVYTALKLNGLVGLVIFVVVTPSGH